MKRKKIAIRLLIFCYIITFLVGGSICAMSYYTYQTGMTRTYQVVIKGLLNYAVMGCNTKELEKAVKSEKVNKEYKKFKKKLDNLKETQNVEYIYAVVPLNEEEEDNMKYVVAAETEEEKNNDEPTPLGKLSGTEYTPDVVKYYHDSFNGSGDVTYFSNYTEFGFMYTGMIPIKNSEGKPICVLAIDISMNELKETLSKFLHIIVIGGLVLTDIFIAIIYGWLIKKLINPLTYIEIATSNFLKMSKEESIPDNIEYVRPQIYSNDEFEVLNEQVDSLANGMKKYMIKYHNEINQKAQTEEEIAQIYDIQKKIVPKIFVSFPSIDSIDMYSAIFGQKQFAKVFLDYFIIDNDHIGMNLLDFSEEGIATTMYMLVARNIIRTQASLKKDPAQIFQILSSQLFEGVDTKIALKSILGILEISTGTIQMTNAGFTKPILKNIEGDVMEVDMEINEPFKRGILQTFSNYEYTLKESEKLFLVSPGIIKTKDENNEPFGVNRMLETIRKDGEKSIYDIICSSKKAFERFVNEEVEMYDLVMIGMEYKK